MMLPASLRLVVAVGSAGYTDAETIDRALAAAVERLGPDILVIRSGARPASTLIGARADAAGITHRAPKAPWREPCRASCPPEHRRGNKDGSDYCPSAARSLYQDLIAAKPDLILVFIHDGAYRGDTQGFFQSARGAGIPTLKWHQEVPPAQRKKSTRATTGRTRTAAAQSGHHDWPES